MLSSLLIIKPFLPLDPRVEGAGLWHHGGEWKADVGVGGEPAEGAQAPKHSSVLRPHHRPDQCNVIHCYGALWRWGPVQSHHPVYQGKVTMIRRLELHKYCRLCVVSYVFFPYTRPFKSLGSLRNDFIFQRKALFFNKDNIKLIINTLSTLLMW